VDILFLSWFKNTFLVTVSLLKYRVKAVYKQKTGKQVQHNGRGLF